MSHPEIDPIQEVILRIATTTDTSFDECEQAYDLFYNMFGQDHNKALKETELVAERAHKLNQPVMSPFYPFLSPYGMAQERVSYLLDLRTFDEFDPDSHEPNEEDLKDKMGPLWPLWLGVSRLFSKICDCIGYLYMKLAPIKLKHWLLHAAIWLTDNLTDYI